jgi:hypothetical protein
VRTSSGILSRIGGAAAVVGGLLWSVKAFHDRHDASPWPTDLTDALSFFVPLLFLLRLAGLYAACRDVLGMGADSLDGVRRRVRRIDGVNRGDDHHGRQGMAHVVTRDLVEAVILRVLPREPRDGVPRQRHRAGRRAGAPGGVAHPDRHAGLVAQPRGRSS